MSQETRRLSRRELLKQMGIVGASAAAPIGVVSGSRVPDTDSFPAPAPSAREALETLTAAESDTLEAIVARLIPADENGPGATAARAAHYIDRALGGPLAGSRQAYAAGLSATDSYAQASKGAPFAKLSAKDQDAVLTDMERNVAAGFRPDSAAFFRLVRSHTIEGTFSDPYYGGNAGFVGWDLIGYPGVRTTVSADGQRMGITLKPNHKSAYDYAMFSKAGVSHDH